MQTGSCYDDIIERNFNTGLPKGISFITSKQLEGKKKKDNRVDEQDLPYEEREFNMKFRETWAIQRKIAQSFKEMQDENAGDARKMMFGLVKEQDRDDEARQPHFIKAAQIFMTEETKNNIEELERKAKEMAKDFPKKKGDYLDEEEPDIVSDKKSSKQGGSKYVPSDHFESHRHDLQDLGPIERLTMNNLCDRAFNDYSLVQAFYGDLDQYE